jgi:indole-3-glycerol phosphate synthase
MIRVAESGIRNVDDVKRVQDLGYHAVLVGEALVRSPHPDLLIQKLKGVP